MLRVRCLGLVTCCSPQRCCTSSPARQGRSAANLRCLQANRCNRCGQRPHAASTYAWHQFHRVVEDLLYRGPEPLALFRPSNKASTWGNASVLGLKSIRSAKLATADRITGCQTSFSKSGWIGAYFEGIRNPLVFASAYYAWPGSRVPPQRDPVHCLDFFQTGCYYDTMK